MAPKEYQKFTETTAIYPCGLALEYLALNTASEAGEVAGKLAKAIRDDWSFDQFRDEVEPELGDLLWHISQFCNELGFTIEGLMESNKDKLTSRKERGVLSGSGDNR